MTDTKYRFTHPIYYCFVIVVCVLGVHGEERTATEWVEAMHKAQSEMGFEGTLEIWNGIALTTIEYCQYVIDGKVQVKAKPSEGPQREINRTDKELSISFAADDEFHEFGNELSGDSLSRLFPPDIATLSESYDIAKMPDQEIADRDAVGISIMPKQADRHGFKIWIDKSTALLLRMEMCDCDDARRILSMLVFTEIKVLEGSGPVLSVAEETKESDLSVSIVNEDESDSSGVQADWEASYMPEGFKLSGIKSKDGVLMHRTYSDGMNAVTVEIRPMSTKLNGELHIEKIVGPTIIATRNALDARGRPQIITVVGDLPRRTIWKISEGVKFER
ncbi:MAG: hypothetical protein F4W92_07810 [Gammaproteobacteria bacterium]|nr:hypothetical protein [Gammaproteobacteria bacterium]